MASSAALELIIGVTDKASGPLKKLAGGLSALGKIGGGALLGGAIAGVGALSAALVTGIGDARSAAQVMAATENVIKSMGRTGQISAEQISDMAASLSAAEGKSLFGDDDIQSGQNMLLTFANINEVLPEATQAMVDMTQFMGGDMVGASTMLGKALDNPTQGLSALSRVGVSFSEQQKEQIKTMQAAGNMAGAQGVILDALKSQFGGAALAAAQADGGWAQFRDRMGEIGESVGGKLLPTLNLIPQALNSPEVQGAIAGFADGLATVVGGAISWVVTTGVPMLTTGLSTIATTINDWVITPAKNVVAAFNEWKAFGTEWGIVAALQEIGNNFPLLQPLTDWLASVAPGLVQGVREAFGLARDAFITFRDALAGEWTPNTDAIHPLHQAVGEFGLMIRNEVMPALKDLYNNLIAEAPKAWATFKNSIQTDVLPVMKLMSDALNKQKNEDLPTTTFSWQKFGTDVATVLNDTQRNMSELGASARRGLLEMAADGRAWLLDWSVMLVTWVEQFRQSVVDVVAEMITLPGRIKAAVGALGSLLYQSGVDLIQGLINGIKSIDVGTILGGILQAGIAAAKATVGIKSPSTKTRDEIGKPMGEGIVVGIEGTATSVKQAIGRTILGAIQVSDLVPQATKSGKDVATAFKDGLATGLDDEASVKQIFGGKLRAAVEVAMEDVKQIMGGKLRGSERVEDEAGAAGERIGAALVAGFNRIVSGFNFGGVDMTFVPGPGHTESADPPSTKGPRRAMGGPVSAYTPYWVGERGPEAFVPRQSGTIIPNDRLGTTVTINIDAKGASDPRGVEEAVDRAFRKLGIQTDLRLRTT